MSTERLRNKQIKFYLSEEEKKILQDKARYCGMEVSQLLRHFIFEGEVTVHKLPVDEIQKNQTQIDETNFEVKKIGNNINQLVKVIHEQNDVYSKRQIEEIINNLNEVIDKYRKVFNGIFIKLYGEM